jgi:hypothetical protein
MANRSVYTFGSIISRYRRLYDGSSTRRTASSLGWYSGLYRQNDTEKKILTSHIEQAPREPGVVFVVE